jgi:hypothetical protein
LAGAVGDGEVGGGAGDGDHPAVVLAMVKRAQQQEVGQFGEAAVFPMDYVVGV